MKTGLKTLGKILAVVGVACLLLGTAGQPQRSGAVYFREAQTLYVYASINEHWSYGQWDSDLGDWMPENSRDAYGNLVVPFSMNEGRWLAAVLYSYTAELAIEATWVWDNYPIL